jgi:hypothetical protein
MVPMPACDERRKRIRRIAETDLPSTIVRRPHLPGPHQLRQQQRREEKLKDIREQVAQGKLVVRRMTAEERKRFPPRDVAATRRANKRS